MERRIMGKRSTRVPAKPAPRPLRQKATPTAEENDDVIELESKESFPASDAPSWTVTRVGHPDRGEKKR
jgi:hypothetical protein